MATGGRFAGPRTTEAAASSRRWRTWPSGTSLRDHSLGGPQLTELLLSTRRFDHPKANDAFGLVWGEFGGRRTLWYEGGDAGFSAYMGPLADDDLSVIVLSNFGTGNAADRARRVLRVLLE